VPESETLNEKFHKLLREESVHAMPGIWHPVVTPFSLIPLQFIPIDARSIVVAENIRLTTWFHNDSGKPSPNMLGEMSAFELTPVKFRFE
jgi:hypothetical protein